MLGSHQGRESHLEAFVFISFESVYWMFICCFGGVKESKSRKNPCKSHALSSGFPVGLPVGFPSGLLAGTSWGSKCGQAIIERGSFIAPRPHNPAVAVEVVLDVAELEADGPPESVSRHICHSLDESCWIEPFRLHSSHQKYCRCYSAQISVVVSRRKRSNSHAG